MSMKVDNDDDNFSLETLDHQMIEGDLTIRLGERAFSDLCGVSADAITG